MMKPCLFFLGSLTIFVYCVSSAFVCRFLGLRRLMYHSGFFYQFSSLFTHGLRPTSALGNMHSQHFAMGRFRFASRAWNPVSSRYSLLERFWSSSLFESIIYLVCCHQWIILQLSVTVSFQRSCCILVWPVSFIPFGSSTSLLLLFAQGLRSAGAPRITHSSHRVPRTFEGLVSSTPFVWVSSHYLAIRFHSDAIVRV